MTSVDAAHPDLDDADDDDLVPSPESLAAVAELAATAAARGMPAVCSMLMDTVEQQAARRAQHTEGVTL